MEQVQLKYSNVLFEADIDITVEEWKSMLQNLKIFAKPSLDMIFRWWQSQFYAHVLWDQFLWQFALTTLRETFSGESSRVGGKRKIY